MRLIGALLLALATPVLAEEFVTLKGHGGPIMGLAVSGTGEVAAPASTIRSDAGRNTGRNG